MIVTALAVLWFFCGAASTAVLIFWAWCRNCDRKPSEKLPAEMRDKFPAIRVVQCCQMCGVTRSWVFTNKQFVADAIIARTNGGWHSHRWGMICNNCNNRVQLGELDPQ